ncbi:MAG: hypothetical protein ACPHCJ_11880, partial [Oceanococcaceae bacterium]
MSSAPRPTLKSHIAQWITRGPTAGVRRKGGGGQWLEFYYQAGDPYSHLGAQWLTQLQRRLRIPLRVLPVPAPTPESYPEAERQQAFAHSDALRIAPAFGGRYEAQRIPSAEDCERVTRTLLGARTLDEFVQRESLCARAIYQGEDLRAVASRFAALDRGAAARIAQSNARRRASLGHYLGGMWQFNGEWFWGLDRMALLEQALRAAGVLGGDGPLLRLRPEQAVLPERPQGAPLEFWFSFRSPYSWLAAMRLQQRPALHGALQIRPVLPMVMRGLPVPKAKRLYIVRDTRRVAEVMGLPFGRIADPVGAGAERCLKVFPLAVD